MATQAHPKLEPALYAQVANAVVAMLLAFGVLSGTIGDAVLVAVAAAVAIVTAATTRPWTASLFGTAVQACLAAVVAFGFPLSDAQSGAVMTAATLVIGLLVRGQVSPKTAAA